MDDDVDLLHRLLLTELYLGPQSTEESVSLALVARYYERLADHGVELGRQLAYAVTGLRPAQHRHGLTRPHPAPTGRYAGRTKESRMSNAPTVLFLCVHNAGRSQMAAGWLRHLAGDNAAVLSGGSQPAEELNPAAVEAMAEVGVDITGAEPTRWTDADLDDADVVITMGCGDECPYIPGKRYLDWDLDDPAGQPLEEVRRIRDDIERRVRALMDDLGVTPR
jgi:arsenate reductase (thioredoxin)